MSDKPHVPHWMPGTATKAALADRDAAERFAHITYGELVKYFGLGTTHTFVSWDQLPQVDRDKWIGALTEVRQDLQDAEENPVNRRLGDPPAQRH